MFVSSLLAAALALSAQCTDPPSNQGVEEVFDLPFSFSDGYRTLIDVRLPRAAPGPCGWPLVMLVHSSGTGRFQVESEARQLAARGYVTATYDVRGQGAAMALNDPRFFGRGVLGLRERIDLWEIMEEVERLYPAQVDFDRIGVSGRSQGAVHSWFAAAHSGRAIPPNPWRTAPAPEVHAIVPLNFTPQFVDEIFPGRQTISELAMRQFYDPVGVGIHSPPNVYATIEPYLIAEDYQGLATFLDEPELDLRQLLPQCSVPTLCSLVYDDVFGPVNLLAKEWDSFFLPGTPKVLNLGTFGHGTPVNYREASWIEFSRTLWFDRHLKGIVNVSDDWAPIRLAIQPADEAEYLGWSSIWDVRQSDQIPIPGTADQVWYLDGANGLQDQPQAGTGNWTLHQQWSQPFDALDYAALLPTPEELQNQALPRDVESFVSPPLANEIQILGECVLELPVTTAASDFQIHAALFDDTNGRFLTGGFVTVRGNTNATEQRVDVPLNFTGTHLPAGRQLRLEVDHLAWHRIATGASYLHGLPVFQDFQLDYRWGGADGAQLRLPLAPLDEISLLSSAAVLKRKGNDNGRLHLRWHEDLAGWSYQILGTTSGTTPGRNFLNVTIPLNFDLLTDRIRNNPGSLPIANFSGVLQSGDREIIAPISWAAMGTLPAAVQQLHFAAVLVDPSGTSARVTRAEAVPVDE